MYKGISIKEDIFFPFRSSEMREKKLVFLVCILFLAILLLFHLLLPEMQDGSISMVRSIGRTGNQLLFPKVRGGSSGALRHGEVSGGDLHQVRLQWCHFGGFRLKLLRSLHWSLFKMRLISCIPQSWALLTYFFMAPAADNKLPGIYFLVLQNNILFSHFTMSHEN